MVKECLLCEQTLDATPSWQSLLGLDQQAFICGDCSNSFKRADIDIKEEGTTIDRTTSLYKYNAAMKEFLHQFKFLQDVALAEVFADDLRRVLKKDAIIVPIPMHPAKKVARTFAQVEALLKSANVPYMDVLEKTDMVSMGEKTKAERLAMPSLFKVKTNVTIKPTTYIVVDDIYTTGTTLRHAATALKEAGATRVEAVTLIRA